MGVRVKYHRRKPPKPGTTLIFVVFFSKTPFQLEVSAEIAKERKQEWLEVIKFNWNTFSDPDLKRQFKKYSKLGSDALPEDKLNRLNKITSEMQKIYSTAKICAYDNSSQCDLALEPELTQILANSRDDEELKHVWVEWRNAVGPHCKRLFEEYVDLSNEAARLNNFTDNTESWLDGYEDPQFRQQIESLWEQLKPLYLQIHAYVRYKLREKYGDVVSEKGPIPVHLLGTGGISTGQKLFGCFREHVGAEVAKRGRADFTVPR